MNQNRGHIIGEARVHANVFFSKRYTIQSESVILQVHVLQATMRRLETFCSRSQFKLILFDVQMNHRVCSINSTFSFIVFYVIYGVNDVVSIRVVCEPEPENRFRVVRDDGNTHAIWRQVQIADDLTDESHVTQPVEISDTSGLVQHEDDVGDTGASFKQHTSEIYNIWTRESNSRLS
jgi:hypothetical protein